jgi:hypothetical protein
LPRRRRRRFFGAPVGASCEGPASLPAEVSLPGAPSTGAADSVSRGASAAASSACADAGSSRTASGVGTDPFLETTSVVAGAAVGASTPPGLVPSGAATAWVMSFDSGTMLSLAMGGATYPRKSPHASPPFGFPDSAKSVAPLEERANVPKVTVGRFPGRGRVPMVSRPSGLTRPCVEPHRKASE